MLTLFIDGERLEMRPGSLLTAALAKSGNPAARRSVGGEARTPFCGMGICQECRVQVDGVRRLACQTPCQDGMQVERLS